MSQAARPHRTPEQSPSRKKEPPGVYPGGSAATPFSRRRTTNAKRRSEREGTARVRRCPYHPAICPEDAASVRAQQVLPGEGELNVVGRGVTFRPMPRPDLLETFPNPYPARDYEIHMTCPEFTSLCPLGGIETDAAELELLKGGAPDFATINVTYVPDELCIELKSLKLYFWSFRNDGIFYERVVNRILDDLSERVKPRWMRVEGDFNVRGGIKSVIRAEVGGR